MATIKEDYVSFETSKLLKDKGFVTPCDWLYLSDGTFGHRNSLWDKEMFPAPSQSIAMKWLREVHKLYIEVRPNPLDFKHEDIQDGWGCEVTHLSDLSYDSDYEFFQKKYETYEEACEAAIKYCLENLI